MEEEMRKRMREEIVRELNEQQQVMDEELYAIIDRKILEYGSRPGLCREEWLHGAVGKDL